MRFAPTTIASLSFMGLAFAQNSGTNSTDVVTIRVGATASDNGGIFQFIPNTVTARNGTVINFQFTGIKRPGNHSITQSTFNAPCTPMNGGFDSGWVLLPTAGLSPVPQWNLTITDDSRPIWFFCKQLAPQPHCPSGMVGAINPPSSGNTFDNFRQAASSVRDVSQSQNGLVGVGASASARPEPLPSGASEFPASGAPSPTSGGSGGAPGPSGTSGALAITVQSGFVAFVAGMTGILLA
ncbi:hypothetical protein AN958_06985 [Leucoagaricus sp. SymC.cos]|nr:hypothetical protein AN958_06985 [Leucoagaricus sp. SymC.cos]